MLKLERPEADRHWWYRLVKVLHIVVSAAFLIALFTIAYTFWPVVEPWSSTYSIKCDSGLTFGDFPSSDFSIHYNSEGVSNMVIPNDESGYDLDVSAKSICTAGKPVTPAQVNDTLVHINDDRGTFLQGLIAPKDYSVILNKKEYYPAIFQYGVGVLIGIVAWLLWIILVPVTFNYIVFGKKK